jgi:excisionase family DNA binding protein
MNKAGKDILGVQLYNTTEAAALLGISRITVHKYIKAGRLRARRIGRPLMITDEDLRAFLSGVIDQAKKRSGHEGTTPKT